MRFCQNQIFSAPFIAIVAAMMSASCMSQENTTPQTVKTDTLSNAIITDLNQLAYTIANEHDEFYSFIGVRALAITHLAMHNALNAIQPEYETYQFTTENVDAEPVSALANAARVVLTTIYPERTDTIAIVTEKWIGSVAEGPQKTSGLQLGAQAAQHLLQLRAGDGHEKNGDYTPMTKPGDYQYTPGYDWVWKPDFSYVRPFTLDSLTQFRSPPPPALTGAEYADAFDEVKTFGSKDSHVRSADQTHVAHWWAEFGEHSWNRIGRITARQKDLSIHETARMFALINMTLYDFYLVTFESKYYYDTWRPFTAIRNADTDANSATTAAPAWEPEMVTPPWPEYPSAHAGVGALGAVIIGDVCGTPEVSFTMESVTAPAGSPERTYYHLDTAAQHCADSRIYNGYHFRFATEAGLEQGRAVAKFVCGGFLREIK